MTENEKKYFEAGEKLRAVGASFLVSYLYWKIIDPTHINWRFAKTNNPNTIEVNKNYWGIWISAIIHKNPASLEQNKINLTGSQIVSMAKRLLPFLQISHLE
jgi:hypothetical protein